MMTTNSPHRSAIAATLLALTACNDGVPPTTSASTTGLTAPDAVSRAAPSSAHHVPPGGAASAEASAAAAAVRTIYAPYLMSAEQMAVADIAGVMDRPIYSAGLARIVAAWRAANTGRGPAGLDGADWLCSCDRWNAGHARVAVGLVSARAGGRYQVTVTFNPGFDAPNASTDLFMVRENGHWLVDDASFTAAEPMLREMLIAETPHGSQGGG